MHTRDECDKSNNKREEEENINKSTRMQQTQ